MALPPQKIIKKWDAPKSTINCLNGVQRSPKPFQNGLQMEPRSRQGDIEILLLFIMFRSNLASQSRPQIDEKTGPASEYALEPLFLWNLMNKCQNRGGTLERKIVLFQASTAKSSADLQNGFHRGAQAVQSRVFTSKMASQTTKMMPKLSPNRSPVA